MKSSIIHVLAAAASATALRIMPAMLLPDGPPAFLTREDGKNGKLGSLLLERGVPSEELPCIAFKRLPGFAELREALASGGQDWVVITSPEAATVFIEACGTHGSLPEGLRLATVGAGTAKVLSDANLQADFVPSKATGKTLAAELPAASPCRVLYPASALASNVVEGGLEGRGFSMRRINTYTTVPATWDAADLERARSAEIITFASPSAVRVWAERVGTSATAVCIGETSAAEARQVGFQAVHCPDSPGVESWADTVTGLGLWETAS